MRRERGAVDALRGQRGLSTMEIAVAMILIAVVAAVFKVAYRSVSASNVDVSATTEMQLAVKDFGREIESDLGRAGFGMQGASAFKTMGASDLKFSYRDVLETYCKSDEVATIRYTLAKNKLVRELSCNATAKPKRETGVGRDSLALSFRYLDDTGKATSSSSQVRTVEYTVDLYSSRISKSAKKKRTSAGSVTIVNNG
jgi:hypothetical protein